MGRKGYAGFNIFTFCRNRRRLRKYALVIFGIFQFFVFLCRETIHYAMKISFCITCMNRLEHLQATLERNIPDNLPEGQVEFVLLDYYSTDGLHEWVRQHMGELHQPRPAELLPHVRTAALPAQPQHGVPPGAGRHSLQP